MSNVAVIGGGAAGMMAACTAAGNGHQVTLYEQNKKLGKKIYITGKGRCNLTNACDTEDLFAAIRKNEEFLYSAIYTFDNHATMDYFERLGLKMKTERKIRYQSTMLWWLPVAACLIRRQVRMEVVLPCVKNWDILLRNYVLP